MTQGRFFCLTKTLTGIEPAEVEVPEGTGEEWFTLHIDNTDNLLTKVTYQYTIGGETEDREISLVGERTKNVPVSLNGATKLSISAIEFAEGVSADHIFKATLSSNGTSSVDASAETTGEITSNISSIEFLPGNEDTHVYLGAKKTIHDGTFTLNVVSGNGIIEEINYKIISRNVADGTPAESTKDVKYPAWSEPVSFKNAQSIEVKIKALGEGITETVYETVALVSINDVERTWTQKYNEVKIDLNDPEAYGGTGSLTIPVKATVKPEYKTGKLHIDVLSKNDVMENGKTAKIISIDKIGYAFEGFNVGGSTTDNDVDVETQNGIDVEYKFAKSVQLKVVTDDGTSNKYEYRFNDKADNQKAKGTLSEKITLADNASTVKIRPEQVKFDATLTVNSTSDNQIDNFTYQFYSDKEGSVAIGEPGVITVSQSGVNTKELSYEGARSVKFSAFKKGSAAIDLDKTALKLDGKISNGEDAACLLELGQDGRTVKIETIGKKAVTLSVNDADKDKFSSGALTYELDGDQKIATTPTYNASTGKVVIYVEPGLTLSTNLLAPAENYYFPEASKNGAKIDLTLVKNESKEVTDRVWTIGKIDSDTLINVKANTFIADYDDSNSKVTIKLDGSPKLEGAVFGSAVASVPSVSTSNIFSTDGTGNLSVAMTVSNGNLDKLYKITKVTYTEEDGTVKEIKGTDIVTSDSGTNINRNPNTVYKVFTVSIPAKDVRAGLMKNGNFEITATQTAEDEFYNVSVTTEEGFKNVSVVYGDEIVSVNGAATETIDSYFGSGATAKSHYVKYGDKVSFVIEMKDGYKLKKAEIKDLSDKLIVSENKLKFDVATRDGLKAVLTAEEDYYASIKYKNNDEVTKGKKGYEVIYNKPVSLALLKGNGSSTSMNLVAKIGSKDVTSDLITAGALKAVSSGSVTIGYEFNGDTDATRGKTIVVTMFAGGTSATDASARTLTLIVDNANKSFKFKKAEETMAVGATLKLAPTVKGVYDTKITVNGAATGVDASGKKYTATGVTIELSDDNKTLTVTTTAALAAEKEFKVAVLDKNDSDKALGEVTIKATFDDIKAATPTAKVANITNNSITVALTAGKLDKDLDGLYYYIKATRTDTVGGTLLKSSVEEYVPVKVGKEYTASHIINLLKDGATEAEKLSGIKGATYKIEVKMVQRNAGSNISGAESKTFEIKNATEMKEGGIFETKLKLKKVSKGNPYTNMSKADNLPYYIQPVYSKNTSIQRLDTAKAVELCNTDGGTIDWANSTTPGTYLEVTDSLITFYPGNGGGLQAGNYIIKAFALEDTGVDVVATMKIKVAQAIETLELREVPSKLIKLPNGKKTTATLKVYDMTWVNKNGTWAQVNKKTSKVDWTLVTTATTGLADAKEFTYSGVSIKNGKITVDKDVVVKKDITFKVLARAKDYAGNTTIALSDEIILTSQAPALNMEIEKTGGAWADAESSYLTKDLLKDYDGYRDYEYYIPVSVYEKNTAGTKTNVPADFKVSGGKLITTTPTYGWVYDPILDIWKNVVERPSVAYIGLNKPAKLKITATATDGSQRKLVKEITVGYTTDYALSYKLYRSIPDAPTGTDTVVSTNVVANKVLASKAFTFDSYLPAGESIPLVVEGFKMSKGVAYTSLINHKVTVKGGKIVKPVKNTLDYYYIVPNAEQTVVTITDNTTNNRDKITLTINNKAIGSKKLTAAKVTAYNLVDGKDAKGKIFSYINYSGAANYDKVSVNMVKYTLAASNKNASLSASHVIINVTKDDVKGGFGIAGALADNAAYPVMNPKSTVTKLDDGTYAVALDTSKNFYINWATDNTAGTPEYAKAFYSINPGSYKITVTPAKEVTVSGVKRYEATGKAVNVTVSAKKAPKASVKPGNTLDFTAGNTATIVAAKNPKNVVANSIELAYAADGVNRLKNSNIKGKLNHFKTYFQLTDENKKLKFVGAPASGDTPAVDKLDPKNDKNELEGWIGYKYQSLDGTVTTDYYKVTLKTGKNGISK